MHPLGKRDNQEKQGEATSLGDDDLVVDRRGTLLPGQLRVDGNEEGVGGNVLMHFFNHVKQMSEVYDTSRLVLSVLASLSSTLIVEAHPSLKDGDGEGEGGEMTEAEGGAISPSNASQLICSFINSDLVPIRGLEAMGSKILHSSALASAASSRSRGRGYTKPPKWCSWTSRTGTAETPSRE